MIGRSQAARRVALLVDRRQLRLALLQGNRGAEFCGECLRAALGASRGLVRTALSLPSTSATFREDQWLCVRCHGTGSVVRAL